MSTLPSLPPSPPPSTPDALDELFAAQTARVKRTLQTLDARAELHYEGVKPAPDHSEGFSGHYSGKKKQRLDELDGEEQS